MLDTSKQFAVYSGKFFLILYIVQISWTVVDVCSDMIVHWLDFIERFCIKLFFDPFYPSL